MNTNFEIQPQALPNGGIQLRAKSNLSRQDLYSRLPFSSVEIEKLTSSRVTIFGLGAGGALLALRFAQAGVAKLRLIDPSVLQAHNLIRHLGNIEDIGRPKVLIAAELALRHNPLLEVEAFAFDPFAPGSSSEAGSIIAASDLVVAATDRVSVQLAINAATWALGIPGVFGGCYEAAKGGEVLFTLPGEETPCLACLRGGLGLPEQSTPFDYSNATSVQDFQGEPGFAASVDFITNIEAQVALGILLRGTGSLLESYIHPKMNYLLIGGLLGAGFYRFKRPFHIFWQPLCGPRPHCPVCQKGDEEISQELNSQDVLSIDKIDDLIGQFTSASTACTDVKSN